MRELKDPRMLLGFLMIGGLIALALAIAIGHVQQETSYGLPEIIECLKIFSAGFVFWAFTQKGEPPDATKGK